MNSIPINRTNPCSQYKVIVISGPSGSGKTTISKRLVLEVENLHFITTHTTRQPRDGEIDGLDYHFVSRDKFLRLKENNFFVENAQVFNHFYGVSYQEIHNALKLKKNILLEIDWQGAEQVRKVYSSQCFSVFIQTKNLTELRKRLIERGKDSSEVIEKRIEKANFEISKAKKYDLHLVNDALETTFQTIKKAVAEFIGSVEK